MQAKLHNFTAKATVGHVDPPALVTVAKAIGDLDELVRLFANGLSRSKPWQVHLAVHIAEADRLMQVLRLTVALDRPKAEIVEAATDLQMACRRARLSLAGTRADRTAVAALQLATELAAAIVHGLRHTP